MSILPDPKRPNHYLVRHSARQPKTKKVIGLKREGIPTKREAERIEKELIIRVNEKLFRAEVPVWIDCLNSYLDSLPTKGLTQKTIYQRTKILKAYTLPIWENRGIESFNGQELRLFFDTEFKNNAPTHAEFVYHCINGVFKFAVDLGYITKSPMPEVPFKKVDRIKRLLNEEQMKTLLIGSQKLEWHWYPHYAMALYTGMRNGELYALKWENVDLELRQIKVKTSWTKLDGYKATKGNADRILEIPLPLIPTLVELKSTAKEREFVLPRIREWDHGEQARHLKPILKLLELPEIRFHDLRSSWATLLLVKGTAPTKVMFMGGWENLKTMMIYLRKSGMEVKNSTDCLNDFKTHLSIVK